MSSFQNLSVPFNIPIPGGMCPGKMVIVQGNIPSMSQRFAVNLLTRSGDIALHVSPKFKENRIVRNNVLNMNWGPEESNGSMPIYPGQSFEIIILCESYSFKVSFNGLHFCDFSHRLPYNTISNLAVDGEVNVHNVNFKDPNGYGNNNFSNSVPYGFGSDASKYNSGGLYPTIDSYPYPPNTRRSPSPSAPHPSSGGFQLPTPNSPHYPGPNSPNYPNPNGTGYPNTGGAAYPQNPSPYPTQPGYPTIPHQGPYPQIPGSSPNGGSNANSHSKHGFLDQAGAALAGVLGPTLLAGGMNRNHPGYGKPNVLDEAGRALAGIIGGAGLSGTGKTDRDTNPRSPTSQTGFLDQAGTALAGILGGAGLAGATGRSLRGWTPPPSPRPTHSGTILDQAGSALAGILGGGGLGGATGRSLRGMTPPPSPRPTQPGTFLDQAGSALAGILGGGGLTGATGRSPGGMTSPPSTRPTQSGTFLDQAGSALAGILGGGGLTSTPDRSPGGMTSSPPTRPTQSGNFLDQAGSALSGILGGGGLTGTGHHNRKKMGILGGTLGTAVAGAALTGHLNPIKATKKQLKAHKKALKYGLPIAGAGIGAYALHKGLKKGFRRSSSSSSCSSSD